jgi:hypothetical protein
MYNELVCNYACNFQYLEEEKKAREFHANPVPAFVKSPNISRYTSVLSTQPSPFQLELHKRGMIKEQQLRQKVRMYPTPSPPKRNCILVTYKKPCVQVKVNIS